MNYILTKGELRQMQKSNMNEPINVLSNEARESKFGLSKVIVAGALATTLLMGAVVPMASADEVNAVEDIVTSIDDEKEEAEEEAVSTAKPVSVQLNVEDLESASTDLRIVRGSNLVFNEAIDTEVGVEGEDIFKSVVTPRDRTALVDGQRVSVLFSNDGGEELALEHLKREAALEDTKDDDVAIEYSVADKTKIEFDMSFDTDEAGVYGTEFPVPVELDLTDFESITLTYAEVADMSAEDLAQFKADALESFKAFVNEKLTEYDGISADENGVVFNAYENTAPEIILDDLVLQAGTVGFKVTQGFAATDAEDGDLTKEAVVDGEVDTSKPGDYILTYTVTDSDGAVVSQERLVTVEGEEKVDNGIHIVIDNENVNIVDNTINVGNSDDEDNVDIKDPEAPVEDEEDPETPADDEDKPADDEDKPADDEDKPADDEDKPADDEDKPADDEDKPADDKTSEDKPSEDKPSDDKPSEDKPSEDKPSDDKPSEDKPSDDKPSEDKPADDKPSDDKAPVVPSKDDTSS